MPTLTRPETKNQAHDKISTNKTKAYVRMTAGPDFRIRGTVNGKGCTILIDTGCTNTVVRKSLAQLSGVVHLLRDSKDNVRVANGESMGHVMEGCLPIEINGHVYHHDCYVSDKVPEDILLGLDFMTLHGVVIDAGSGTVTLDGKEIPCISRFQTLAKSNRVVTTKSVNVPPGAELIVPTRIAHRKDRYIQSGLAMVEPVTIDSNRILVARTLVSDTNCPAVRIYNPTDEIVTLHKNKLVGSLVCGINAVVPMEDGGDSLSSRGPSVNAIDTRNDGTAPTNHTSSITNLPDYLTECYESAISGLKPTEAKVVSSLLSKNSDVFAKSPEDLGRTSVATHHIDTGTTRPIRQRPRRQPLKWLDTEDSEIQKMLDLGICKPSTSPWASPIVLVRKKDGSCRFCVDYRILNSHTYKDSYPLPRIEDCLDSLSGSKYFATLDLASGYWQVALDDESRQKTAFTSRRGLFEFNVMPYGLCNAPATFERLMERVLSGLQWKVCLVYIDDIIVHGSSVEDLAGRLDKVFDRLRSACLKLKPSKCHLFHRSVEFLGHIVSEEGVKTCSSKIDQIRSWKVPTDVTQVRSFLGLCSYYRRFIKNFATIAKPLHELTTPKTTFTWSDSCQSSFEILKQSLCTAPILAYPSREGMFILDTDASDFGIGGVLSQMQGGKEHVIGYASRCLSKSERKYCTTRKELLAVKFCLEHFHHYIYGRHFKLRTDHAAIRWMLNKTNVQGQYARWLAVMSTYDFEIEHRAGVKHSNADSLSRRPCSQCGRHSMCPSAQEAEDALESSDDHATCNIVTRAGAKRDPAPVSNFQQCQDVIDGWSPEELRVSQLRDPEIRPIIEFLENSPTPPEWEEISRFNKMSKHLWKNWDRLTLHNGVLYRRWESDDGLQIRWQLVVPSDRRKTTFNLLHRSLLGGHLGFKKTLLKVKLRFWWYGMSTCTKLWCMECQECQKSKDPTCRLRAPLKPYVAGYPMERFHVDILGPFHPATSRGNMVIMVCTDSFTKYAVAVPLPHHQAELVANTLVEKVYLHLGIPDELHTDQGTDFESNLFKRVHTLLGVSKTRTTPFHPESNSNVERFNRTLGAMLRCFSQDEPHDWDLHLPYLVAAYNSTVHDSTGFSPNFLMFGREMGQPADLLLDPPGTIPMDIPTYGLQLLDTLRKAHDYAADHLGKSVSTYKQSYDRRVAGQPFSVGDTVWLLQIDRKVGQSAKLEQRKLGPYLIIAKIGSSYRIAKDPNDLGKVVHYNRLQICRGSNLVNWLPEEPKSVSVGTSTEPEILRPVEPVTRIPVQQQGHDSNLAGESRRNLGETGSSLAGETKPKAVNESSTVNRPVPRPRRQVRPPDRLGQTGPVNTVVTGRNV